MTESQMTTFFKGYLATHPPIQSEVYELKICNGKSLPFSAIKEHQIQALLEVENVGLYHKLTDPPVFYGMNSRFNSPRPFDCMYLKGIPGFIVVWFYKPRQPKSFIKIPIENFIEMDNNANRKSFTEEMAKECGEELAL